MVFRERARFLKTFEHFFAEFVARKQDFEARLGRMPTNMACRGEISGAKGPSAARLGNDAFN